MKLNFSIFIIKLILSVQCLSVLCAAKDFDFFYLVQQWPGSYCDTKRGCCYPKTGKPAADFSIHGLWPNYNNGSWPSNCNRDSQFDISKLSDLRSSLEKEWPTLACPSGDGLKFWEHEREKHGTCSEAVFNQHDYFEATLKLKERANLLQILTNAGIEPNDEFYELKRIKEVIQEVTGHTPGISCNFDPSKNSQLHEIYLCVDASGTQFITCPYLARRRCGEKIQFPKF